jgi:hypothetical protein
LTDWDNFVAAVAQRYAGRIDFYEIWNEPDLPKFWTGSTAQMVAMAIRANTIIKQIDAHAKVLSPSISNVAHVSWLDSYLSAGGVQATDIVSFHGYGFTYDPEDITAAMAAIKASAHSAGLDDAEVWDTEASWGDTSLINSDQQLRWIVAFHLFQAASGVKRFMWYAYNSPIWGTLTTDPMSSTGYQLTGAGRAYNTVVDLLSGNTLNGCGRDPQGVWECEISNQQGYLGVVLWSDGATVNYAVDPALKIVSVYDFGTDTRTPLAGSQVEVGVVPQLLENGVARH